MAPKHLRAGVRSTPDTLNRHFVGVRNADVVVLQPSTVMSMPDALSFAAWIVTVCEGIDPAAGAQFLEVLEAIRSA